MSIHDFTYTFISSFIALFPVVNPISSGIIIEGFLHNLDDAARKNIIRKIALNCMLIGIGSLVAGHLILLLFNLAIPVIQLAGGFLICKTGLENLSDAGSSSADADKQEKINKINAKNIEKKIFYPISFPISFGPGTISVIFTLMAGASTNKDWLLTSINFALIAVVIVIMSILIYVFCLQGHKIMHRLGESGNLIINKLVAFFTFCIGVQIVVTGIARIFHISIL